MPSPLSWQTVNTSAITKQKERLFEPPSRPPTDSRLTYPTSSTSSSPPNSTSSPEDSPTTTSPSSSSSSRTFQHSGASSFNSTSPPQSDPWAGAILPTLTGSGPSPRTQDLLQTQRDLFHRQPSPHHKPLPPPPHLHRSFSDWQNSLQVKAAQRSTSSQGCSPSHPPYSNPGPPESLLAASSARPMHTTTATSSSTSAYVTPDLGNASSYSTHQKRDEDEVMRSPERTRGTKSRRASSGGSRISEGVRRDNTEIGNPQVGETGLVGTEASSRAPYHAEQPPHGAPGPSSSSRWSATARTPPTTSNVASPSTFTSSGSSSVPASSSAGHPSAATTAPRRALPHLDLANYSPQELLKVLAALLHQIASSNDHLRPTNGQESRDRKKRAPQKAGHAEEAGQSMTAKSSGASTPGLVESGRRKVTTAAMGALGTPSSTLCFHARNIPSISIESYLLRILKYCPTTNDVFLSLLVYFDRMSRMGVGAAPGSSSDSPAGAAAGLPQPEVEERQRGMQEDGEGAGLSEDDAHPGMKGFVIDSYNVHRLVIAGITVASKFFSDIFYTNSRYAKVGGLPVHELNQLELQFLLLNDFRLVIPLEELQRYADQLLVYGTEGGAVHPARVKEISSSGGGGVRATAEEGQKGASSSMAQKAQNASVEGEAGEAAGTKLTTTPTAHAGNVSVAMETDHHPASVPALVPAHVDVDVDRAMPPHPSAASTATAFAGGSVM